LSKLTSLENYVYGEGLISMQNKSPKQHGPWYADQKKREGWVSSISELRMRLF
jgi:hypothetical protein